MCKQLESLINLFLGNRLFFTLNHFLVIVSLTLFSTSHCVAIETPNIVIIMLDDMGFSDLGCYGGEIQTPHIDQLSKNGLRFTEFYNCARCCPTRASLLTGLYPHQVGLKKNGLSLSRNGVTIAEVLRQAGYQTAMTGKWHLSKTPVLKKRHLQWVNHRYYPNRPFAALDSYPVRRGFDKHYGVIWGVVNYFDPFSLVDGIKPVNQVPDDFYMTDAITSKSVQYIEEFSNSDQPFFLYVAHCAPHWPLHARPEDIEKYKNTYRNGWHALRKQRFKRQVEMGLFNPENTKLPPIQGAAPNWQKLSEDQKKNAAQQMAVHAAMIDCVDQGVGKMVETLKKKKLFNNTLIIVLSDNGASPERYLRSGYDRPSRLRNGQPIQYKGSFKVGSEKTWGYIGPQWASAANTPFRYWKKESFEGGCHTPLIIHWPAGLKTKKGSITKQVGHVIDILPTCLSLSGVKYPAEFNGQQITPVEGISLLPILNGENRESHETLFFEHMGGRAVRTGIWKLVALKNEPWQLYNLSLDRTETNNLAAKEPQRVKQLTNLWQQWAKRVGAVD